jgi:CheY-like chemotaxis protein
MPGVASLAVAKRIDKNWPQRGRKWECDDAMNVLVIEDSRFLRGLISKTLTLAGYSVTAVADGEAGVLEARASLPSLILLDMMLPGLDGTRVLKALKEDASTAKIPVIVMTGLSQRNAAKLKKAGAVAFIEKTQLKLDESADALIPIIEKTIGPPSPNPVRSAERRAEAVAGLEMHERQSPSKEILP